MPDSDSQRATIPNRTGASAPSPSTNSYRDSGPSVFALLLAFRIANALTLRTFFQPDEYFQSLEPAWQLAFGQGSNAWITWVNALSTLHYARIISCPHTILPPSLVLGSCLTMPPGVENAVALVPASSHIRCSLSGGGKIGRLMWLDHV